MRFPRSKLVSILAAGVLLGAVACSSDGPTQPPPIQNPATIRVINGTSGKIIFLFFRDCGSTNWGDDRLPEDPVTGVIVPTESKDFTVEEGCYDLRADHLEGPQPGPLVTETSLNRVVIKGTTLTWVVSGEPPGQD